MRAAVNWALEAGYRQYDTAFVYHNEKPIGDVIYKLVSLLSQLTFIKPENVGIL